ncbi:unnamed protein product [Echinostoma caproni]|uniref:CPSF_A domain-containing protein n=1 Tax=Echinostoma caproni TaxID=27848 RepID=A0A183B7Y4_9TREM|nr:unnamed protein product [Echinostoma caproni]
MVRHVIKGIHHNPVVAPLYVSPSADILISGDSRGSVVHCRYNSTLNAYQSYVLTVVPGSVRDLKLIQGSLLFLTCYPFPNDRVCDEMDEDTVEVIHERGPLHFLYEIASRKLIKLDLIKLLPPELNLT